MNKRLIITLVASLVLAITVGIIVTFAWYTNAHKTDSMDYVSNGLVISYKIENEVNVEEYNVKDVVFFDPASSKEGKYLSASAVKLTLDISNYSATAVNVSLKQSVQPFTLSNTLSNNVITIYKYTKANVNRDTQFTANTYYTFDNETGYTAKTKYESGNIYYEKDILAVSTVTVESNKLKTVSSVDKNNNALISTISSDGLDFIIGKYIEATNLDKASFNAGVYYTLSAGVYTQAKVYDEHTTYYENSTIAYVGGLSFSGTSVTEATLTTTGAFISCIITDTEINTVSETGSINDYLNTNYLSNEFSISNSLAASTQYNTAGGTKRVYLYIFGIQLFEEATSNFLENERNVYPFTLIITANQV